MVKCSLDSLSLVFAALSDPTRRAILAQLAAGEATVSELAGPFSMSLPAVSKHLKVLESAGLLARRREGRVHRCVLNAAPMKKCADWLTDYRQLWELRLDSLGEFLGDEAESATARTSNREPD